MRERVAARLGAVRHAELAVDVRQVELHRLLGDPQLAADAGVREAVGHQAEDLALAGGEVVAGAERQLALGAASPGAR